MSPKDTALSNEPERWPRPVYDREKEPLFLFIITPPSAGSTALAKILATSNRTMLLHHKGEGQWLLPGLCEPDRWSTKKYIDYESVKAVWLATYQQRLEKNGALEMVVEKSPPNMVRLESLVSHFSRYTLLANNRDPFANCASRLYRKNDADNLDQASRRAALESLLKSWLQLSRQIRDLVMALNVPLVTYEEFCRNPLGALDKIGLPREFITSIDVRAEVKVKDYAKSTIVDKNTEQINKLRPEEIVYIADSLGSEEELLSFFGYTAAAPPDYSST